MGQDNSDGSDEAQDIYDELEPSEQDEDINLEETQQDIDVPENYGIEDAYRDIETVKKEALQSANQPKKKEADSMKDVEKLVDQFEKAIKWKQKGYQERETQIRMHPAYSGLAASQLVIFGFLYHTSGFVLLVLGLVYVILNEVKFLPDKQGKFAEIASRHPTAYLQGSGLTIAMFLGQGYEVGEVQGLTTYLLQVIL